MDRNSKERELFKDWAKHNHKNEWLMYDLKQESYFIKRKQNEEYIWKYDFESVPQLRDLLEEQWKDKSMQEILTAVLVAAMKNKPRTGAIGHEESVRQEVPEKAEELPMYIYNF